MKLIHSISVFGDSILRGVVLNSSTQRYSVSDSIGMDSIAQMFSIEVTNLSRFGCTVERGFEYIKKYFAKGNNTDAVLLELGGNDSDFNWAEVAASPETDHLPNTPLDRFVSIYTEIVDSLRQNGVKAVMTNLPPICPERYLDWICRNGLDKASIMKWLGSTNTIYRYQENYSRTIEQIAKDTGSICVDLRGAFLQNRRVEEYFCEDGIHPNDRGQGIIRNKLIETLNQNKGAIYA